MKYIYIYIYIYIYRYSDNHDIGSPSHRDICTEFDISKAVTGECDNVQECDHAFSNFYRDELPCSAFSLIIVRGFDVKKAPKLGENNSNVEKLVGQ